MSSVFRIVRRLADRLRGIRPDEAPSMPASGFLLHDPASSGPHDLDDPYIDPKAQERVAGVIADSARKPKSD
jgi:hypothetical protein